MRATVRKRGGILSGKFPVMEIGVYLTELKYYKFGAIVTFIHTFEFSN